MEAYATIPAFKVPVEFKAEIINLIKDFGKKANIKIKNLEALNDDKFDDTNKMVETNMSLIKKVFPNLKYDEKNGKKHLAEFDEIVNKIEGSVTDEEAKEIRARRYAK